MLLPFTHDKIQKFYLALLQMMKECSPWVRLQSAQSARSLEEGGNLTQGEQLFLHL